MQGQNSGRIYTKFQCIITVALYIYALFEISITSMNYSYNENRRQRNIHFCF